MILATFRGSRPQVLLVRVVLKICSKFTGEHPCQSVISIKLYSNFIEITLRPGCSRVNLLHIFGTPFPKNTPWWLLLNISLEMFWKVSVLKKLKKFLRDQRWKGPSSVKLQVTFSGFFSAFFLCSYS